MNARQFDACDSRRARRQEFLSLGLAVSLSALLALVLFTTAATEWREMRPPDGMGHDLAIYNQGFSHALHDRGEFRTTIGLSLGPVHSVLASHFAPVFYLLLPFYAGWQSPLLLLLLASCAMAAAGVALFLVARRLFGSTVIALAWFGLFALYLPVLDSVAVNGFRELFLAAAFLSFALLCYLRGLNRLFLLFLVLAISCKEDIALLLPVWGAVAWFQGRGWRLGGGIALLGVVYFLLVNAVVLPVLRGLPAGQLYFAGYASPLGMTPRDLLHSPGEIVRLVLSRRDMTYWYAILSPLLFLPLLGWEYLVIPAFIYVEIALAPFFQEIASQHIMAALPFIFVAAMAGAARLANVVSELITRVAPLQPARVAAIRTGCLAILLCGMAAGISGNASFGFVRGAWPVEADLRKDYPLLHTLDMIPVQASLAATDSLIAEGSRRRVLYSLMADSGREPDYVAINFGDLPTGPAQVWAASVLCGGAYGVVYQDRLGWSGGVRGSTRLLLERGGDVSANHSTYKAAFANTEPMAPRADQSPSMLPVPCPKAVPEGMGPAQFARAAALAARTKFPSVVRPMETFQEPVVAEAGGRYTQVVHLPDQLFVPGRYQIDLLGMWPWPWTPAEWRMGAELLVGARRVGKVTAGSRQLLRYRTSPFQIERRATLPVRVVWSLDARGSAWAMRPRPGACAVVADAPTLNPQQVTVEALVYAEGLVPHAGSEAEAPIVTKGDALGYYLRLSQDSQGKVWVDLNVAGKWAAGRAGFVPLRKWTHIAATYDGHEVRVYVDGLPAIPDPYRSARHEGRVRSEGAPLFIGCRAAGRPDEVDFPGLIARVRVWSRALSAEEIRNEARFQQLSEIHSGLVGSWDFPPPAAGGRIPDGSPAGNDITNGTVLARVAVTDIADPLTVWRSRTANLVRLVTIRSVAP